MPGKTLKHHPTFWRTSFVVWFVALNLLSHGDKFHPSGPFFLFFEIPHFDKILHFGYFFGGGGLLAAALHYRSHPSRKRLLLMVTLVLSGIGVVDEYHQSFFKNRTGNDPFDWLADTLGAFFGALVFSLSHQRLLPTGKNILRKNLPRQKETPHGLSS